MRGETVGGGGARSVVQVQVKGKREKSCKEIDESPENCVYGTAGTLANALPPSTKVSRQKRHTS